MRAAGSTNSFVYALRGSGGSVVWLKVGRDLAAVRLSPLLESSHAEGWLSTQTCLQGLAGAPNNAVSARVYDVFYAPYTNTLWATGDAAGVNTVSRKAVFVLWPCHSRLQDTKTHSGCCNPHCLP